jgi:hypothetical protein
MSSQYNMAFAQQPFANLIAKFPEQCNDAKLIVRAKVTEQKLTDGEDEISVKASLLCAQFHLTQIKPPTFTFLSIYRSVP